jgi:hypothetical protein
MKLTHLTTKNFLGLPSFSVEFDKVTLVCGPNESSKSTLLESIRFALLGQPARGVSQKQNYKQMLTDGATEGFVQITFENDGKEYTCQRSIKTGEGSTAMLNTLPETLKYALDAQQFPSLPQSERRRVLFHLMNIKSDAGAVEKILLGEGVSAEIATTCRSLLKSGFDAAAQYATEQASQARGAWKQITGETYGDKKAETWQPETPAPPNDETLKFALDAVTKAKGARDEAQARLTLAQEYSRQSARRGELQTKAATLSQCKAQLAVAQDNAVESAAAVDVARSHTKGHGGTFFNCPSCQEQLVWDRGAAYIADSGGEPGPDTRVAVSLAEQSHAVALKMVAQQQTAVDNAQAAQAALEALGSVEAPAPAPDLAAHHKAVADAETVLRELNAKRESSDSAKVRVKQALAAHSNVQMWKKATELLSPDGIPAQMLARALKPVNDLLATYAIESQWEPVRIGNDMTLFYGARPYQFAAESAQWRVQAMVAACLAELSGSKVLLLDRMDVLEPALRGDAIAWLLSLAMDTVVVSATLKAPPKIEGVRTVWMGVTQEVAA